MHLSKAKILLSIVILGSLFACEQDKKFGDIPNLQWRSAGVRYLGDSADNRRVIDLTVYFTDGDGDIGREGLSSSDTCLLSNYDRFLERYDLFIYYYEKVNGQYREIPPTDSCFPFHNILPDLMPEGQNKTLEGDITTPFDYANFPANSNADSIRFELMLIDRAGNKSQRIIGKPLAID